MYKQSQGNLKHASGKAPSETCTRTSLSLVRCGRQGRSGWRTIERGACGGTRVETNARGEDGRGKGRRIDLRTARARGVGGSRVRIREWTIDVVGSERAETSRNIEHWTRVRGDFGCDFGGNRRVGGLRVERNARGRVGGGRAWGQGD